MKKLILSVLVGLGLSTAALAGDNNCNGIPKYFNAFNSSCQKLDFVVTNNSSIVSDSSTTLRAGQGKQIRVCSPSFKVKVCAKSCPQSDGSQLCTECTLNHSPIFVTATGIDSCGKPLVTCF